MKIGIALSGGGARGIAHLGILKALREMDIYPEIVSGTSAGAIIGAFYCQGYTPDEILDIFETTSLLRFIRPTIGNGGLLKIEKARDFYLEYLPHNTFEQLKYPLFITATDIENGESVHFSEGNLVEPILASSCIPVMFKPFEWNGKKLVDGGILNNLPAEVLKDKCDFLIGIHTNPYGNGHKIDSMKSMIEKSLMLALATNARHSMLYCDLVIEPKEMNKYSTFDVKKGKEIFEVGYHYAYQLANELDKIKNTVIV